VLTACHASPLTVLFPVCHVVNEVEVGVWHMPQYLTRSRHPRPSPSTCPTARMNGFRQYYIVFLLILEARTNIRYELEMNPYVPSLEHESYRTVHSCRPCHGLRVWFGVTSMTLLCVCAYPSQRKIPGVLIDLKKIVDD
jgi:hypothetical protein